MLWERVSVPKNDWNDKSNAEEWRRSWAEHCNHYLDPDLQIDHRSYERQGVEKVPTIHEGYVAREMEREGRISDRMEINREIIEHNSIVDQIRCLVDIVKDLLEEKLRGMLDRFKSIRQVPGFEYDHSPEMEDLWDARATHGRTKDLDQDLDFDL